MPAPSLRDPTGLDALQLYQLSRLLARHAMG
jgi:hypothetical protein